MRSCPTNTPAPRETTPDADRAPARRRPVRSEASPGVKPRAPAPTRPTVLSSYLVDLTGPGTTAAESAEVTAHIRRVDNAAGALSERGFKLGNSVLDVVSGLLLDLVREDDGGD